MKNPRAKVFRGGKGLTPKGIAKDALFQQALERADFMGILMAMILSNAGGEIILPDPDQYKGRKLTLNYGVEPDGSFKITGGFLPQDPPTPAPMGMESE